MTGARGTPEAILEAHGGVLAPSSSTGDWKAEFGMPAHLPAEAEEALALKFAAEHAHCLRYCAAWSCWLVYGGGVWQRDSTLEVLARVRLLCRKAAEEIETDAKLKQRLASHTTVAAVERLVRADPRLAATSEQWDTSPDLLNTPDGVIDLTTGVVLAHAPDRYLTKRTAVAVAPHGTPHPVWDRFLARVTEGDPELIAFLQRIAGYCLTGHAREHAIFFLFGGGANGKSLFLRTLAAVMADYATTAPMETFMASTHDRHPTDLADLRGARLVFATETEEGRRWAEAKLKQLSGGDPVKARHMREDYFQFQPQFKLLFAGNHKPSLRNIDEAIRRRFHLLHFKVIIPVEERDPGLYDKLRAEWPAILRWMLEGCLAWQRTGLAAPASVSEATAEYLATEDTLQIWLDERTERDATSWTRTANLHGSYRSWAAAAGEHGVNEKRFAQALEDRGYLRKRGPVGLRGFVGIKLKVAEE